MIVGIGIDLCEVERMARELGKSGGGFRDRVFTEEEVQYCQGKRYASQHFAARYAAKEAFFKALGIGLREGLAWKDVEVRNDPQGKPSLKLIGKAELMIEQRAVRNVHLSLTHTRQNAVAVVILES